MSQKKFLTFTTNSEQAEMLSDQLLELGALAIDCHAANEEEIFQVNPNEVQHWQHTLVKALFEDDETLAQALVFCQANSSIKNLALEDEPDTDWVSLNQQQFPPLCFADKLWVCPSWHDANQLSGKVLKLDPGMAFGTGTHPTTAMCLAFLAEQDLTGQLIIDYGCGSGILGIGAAILGAKQVTAIDHDPQAVLATTNNAAHNQVSEQLTASDDSGNTPAADLVVANILANPLIELMPTLTGLTKSGGLIILSGILARDQDKVVNAYQACCDLIESRQQDEWVLLSLRRQT